MNIALDHDGTITRDPALWARFAADAVQAGHDVRIVTMRYPSEGAELEEMALTLGIGVIYSSRQAKRPVCDALGFPVHVWIDDNPRAVEENADQIWTRPAPEGCPIDPAEEERLAMEAQ